MNVNRSAGKAFTEMCGRGVLPFGMVFLSIAELGQYTIYAIINPHNRSTYENGVVNLLRVQGKTQVRRWCDNHVKRGWTPLYTPNLQTP